ncbi:DUF4124 domain-containing protein [uncultured Marinobacter sp.]|uniref:DUF4124 domain-containing protein n=1 Tax=uncultured Marinobacter sp. TaxID=187379 RepID=UPI0030DA2679
MAIHLTRLSLLVGMLVAAPPMTLQASVYRCETADGVVFADQPCGDNAETVTIRDNRIGGSFGDNLPQFPAPASEDSEQAATRTPPQPESPCRYINSTNLRTYLARNQVVQGMTREQVERAFGRTSEVYPTPQETWVYQTRYYGALYELTYVYFRDGCVERVDYRKP